MTYVDGLNDDEALQQHIQYIATEKQLKIQYGTSSKLWPKSTVPIRL